MAVLDAGKLLAPLVGESPSGPNLEYDPAFLALEKAAEGKPEQVLGGVTTGPEPPDWNAVCSQATALLERTRDLRVAGHLARGLLFRSGVVAFAEGLGLIRALLQTQWATLHPQLDPDDDNDPTMRVTAFSALTTPPMIVGLRRAPLLRGRSLGSLTLADILPTEGAPDTARIQGVFIESPFPELELCANALKSGLSDLAAIEQVFSTHTGNHGPDLSPLIRYFEQARQAVEPRLEERRAAEQGASAAAGSEASATGIEAAPPPVHARGLSGDILSREDVVRALDKISLYFQRHEPSSPVPLLLERCKRLVTMDFLDILGDLAPDGVKQAQLVIGKRGDTK